MMKKSVISLIGMPNIISSIKRDNTFKGTADKGCLYTNEEVHLIGNARMVYDNLTISSEFIIFNPVTGKFLQTSFMLIKNISKSIKDKKIISKVSLEINDSDIFGLLGPNGAGKTTMFYIIYGLMNQDEGEMILSDKDISKLPCTKDQNLE